MSRVLFGDDEAAVLWAYSARLESAGHTVITASDATELLDKLVHDAPDVVILDVMMSPGKRIDDPDRGATAGLLAFEIAHAKLKGRVPPTFVLTKVADVRVHERIGKLGLHVIRKPIRPSELLEEVTRCLETASPPEGRRTAVE